MAIRSSLFFSTGIILLILFGLNSISIADSQSLSASEKAKQQYEAAIQASNAKYYKYLTDTLQSKKVLSPAEVRAIKDYSNQIENVKNTQPNLTPKRQTLAYNSDKPPTILIGKNRLSTITFVDGVGNPYPIQNYEVSDTTNFDISQRGKKITLAVNNSNVDSNKYQSSNLLVSSLNDKTNKNNSSKNRSIKPLPASMLNSLTIRGQSNFANGDLIIYLVGKQNAIHIFLEHSQKVYSYQNNITIDGLTPQSLATVSKSGETVTQPTSLLMEILNGTPPKSASEWTITLSNSQIWKVGSNFYVRSRSLLQSPAYLSKVSTATGYNVFKITDTNHVLTFVDHGQLKTAYINHPLTIDRILKNED